MLHLPARDERMALRLDDIASALDAGLDARAVLGGASCAGWPGPIDLGRGLVAGLLTKGAPLTDLELRVLTAAETGGRLPDALRRRAEARRIRARLLAGIYRRMAYPVFLLLFATLVFTAVGSAFGIAWIPLTWIGGFAAITALAVWGWRRVRRDPSARIPLLGGLLDDLAEVPYLETLGGLYGAGIPLPQAHATATTTVPVASVRARLFQAQQLRDGTDSSLTEALAQTRALCPETLQILTPAEASGTLEEALGRAARRRQDTLQARASALSRTLTGAFYGLVVVLITIGLVSFYTSYYGAVGRLTSH